MVELREVDTARAMLRQTAVFTRMKQAEPDRFLRLEHLCGRTYFDIRLAWLVRVSYLGFQGSSARKAWRSCQSASWAAVLF